MAGLIDKPTEDPPVEGATTPHEGAPPAATEHVVVPDDASRLCVNCASLLAEGQDWCLECGTAQPGRLGSNPGWRPALTMVLVTGLLAVGAVAAAYAALSSDAERRATAAPPPSAQPIVPPAAVPPAPAPAVPETPAVKAPKDATDDTPAPKSTPSDDGGGDFTPAPSSDDFSDDTGSSGTSGDTGSSGSSSGTYDDEEEATETKPEPPATIVLGPDAASTFDPRDRAGGLTGDPADAIDGRRKTAWEAPVAPDGRVEIGLLVSLEEAQAIDKVRLLAGTPGFSVELYGSKLGTPPDDAPGATKYWTKLDTTVDFGTDEKLTVGGGKFRHVLLWFTDQPADTKVMIPEVELLP